MDTRTIDRLGREVTVVGLGTWQLGAEWGTVSDEDARDVLDAACQTGVNFYDTADVYGDGRSEQFVGAFRDEHEDVIVATKMGRRVAQEHVNYRRDNFLAWTRRSRENLGVETLDLVQLHCPPDEVIDDDKLFEVLDEMVEDGHMRGLRRLGGDGRPGHALHRAPRRGHRGDHP